jgi:lipoprotein-anchoring transpeptidase ErfK/SrfK
MRSKLGRIAAVWIAAGSVMGIVGATSAGASPQAPGSSSSTTTTIDRGSTSTTSTTSTTTSIATTTTMPLPPAPAVVELPASPSQVTPRRGSQYQVTETLPPPSTTTTTTTTTLPPTALPPDSGTGRRVVYSKSRQRVWTVEADGRVSKTHLVSGRLTWNQPSPGTYSVFSRSGYTCNIKKPYICWRYMVRFTKGPDGDNIGFHEIPVNTRTGQPVQSVWQLGTALSAGCVRQATPDAQYMWNWAGIGTKVVVLG